MSYEDDDHREKPFRDKLWEILCYKTPRSRQKPGDLEPTGPPPEVPRRPGPGDPLFDKIIYTYRLHRYFLYIPFIVGMIIIEIILSLILWIPWTCGFLQPRRVRWIQKDGRSKRIKMKEEGYHHQDDHKDRDIFAPFRYGEEIHSGYWRGFWWRVWEMYTLLRECWHTLHRQGLQIVGIICGFSILMAQVFAMAHDLKDPKFKEYLDAVTSGGGTDQLKSDPTCAYAVGGGIANWAGPFENMAWFILYHSWLIALCIMLIGDEMFNIRMGLFAPQWGRAGTGYTIMFLAIATLTGSPNGFSNSLLRLTYIYYIVILSCGFYNVLRELIAYSGCSSNQEFNSESYRYGRHPLRIWSEKEWSKYSHESNFERENLRGNLNDIKKTMSTSERMQLKIGDHAWPLRKSKHLKSKYDRDRGRNEPVDMAPLRFRRYYDDEENSEDEWEECVVQKKPRWQKDREQGSLSRSMIHPWHIRIPPLTAEQKFMRKRNYVAAPDQYLTDRFLVCIKGKKPGKLREPTLEMLQHAAGDHGGNQVLNLDGELYAWEQPPRGFAVQNLPPNIAPSFEIPWYSDRADRDTKQFERYYGIADWVPNFDGMGRSGTGTWMWWFDMRRIAAVAVAIVMILIHILLLSYNLGWGYASWPTYRIQYDEAATTWSEHHGPSSSDCQFYQGSSLAIWIRLGEGSIQGVFAAMFFYVLWSLFIMLMCVGVILVGLSNNRSWGMHLPIPITLIGPRLSSVSMGWTIGFIGCATLQLGFFNFNAGLMWMARLSGYACIAIWLLFLFTRNEPMRNNYVRAPFIRFLSEVMMRHLDKMKYDRGIIDFDDD